MDDTVKELRQKCPLCGFIITASHEGMLALGVRYHDLQEHNLD